METGTEPCGCSPWEDRRPATPETEREACADPPVTLSETAGPCDTATSAAPSTVSEF